MIKLGEPYFMSNPEWYYYDKNKMSYFLTDKAPLEAQESYKDFYSSFGTIDEGENKIARKLEGRN